MTQRLPPAAWFPAGVEGITARRVSLPDGITLRVCEAGPADGPVLLLLHGWGATARLWHRNIIELAGAGIRVIAPDLPGHGLSDAPDRAGDYTLERFTARMLALLDLLGIPRAVLCGQSMAGKVAVRLALDAPTRVAALVLLGAIGFGRVPPIRALAPFAPLPPPWLGPHLVPRWAVAVVQRQVRGRLLPATADDVDAVWAPSQRPEVIRAQLRMAREFDWAEWTAPDLRRLHLPVQVIFGTRDRTARPLHAERLAALLPQGRFRWIEDGGHVVMEEDPETINTILIEAVRGAANGRGSSSTGPMRLDSA